MSLKEKLKKEEERLARKEQKEIAKLQKKQAKEIYREGFSGFGIRDLLENRAFQLVMLFLITFLIVFFVLGFIQYTFHF
ncbi:MAG: hypothetical protein ACXQS8_01090 [Candidatus Helarchaeales archaeon]